MAGEWAYALASVLIVSALAFIGIITLSISEVKLRKILFFLVSFSVGALLGGAFIHLLPETFREFGFGPEISFYVLLGMLVFFVMEKFVHWRHCHIPASDHHPHPFVYMNLIGDGFHNFIDGMVIAGSYLASIPLGISTTIAVVLHEIPQEIGDFGVLVHGGFGRIKALFYNFISALAAVLGAAAVLIIGARVQNITMFLLPFTAGGFIYIAGADLIPELHKECEGWKSFGQLIAILLGIGVMTAILVI